MGRALLIGVMASGLTILSACGTTSVSGSAVPVTAAAVTAAAATPAPSTTVGSATTGSATPGSATASNATAVEAVERAITNFNATAGGPVATQQSLLATLISTGQSAAQRACPTATRTVSFNPVYARLAAAPGWLPSSGSLPGTVYAVPTLIRIYTGARITGTDLTDLHLAIDGGRVTLPAVCLR